MKSDIQTHSNDLLASKEMDDYSKHLLMSMGRKYFYVFKRNISKKIKKHWHSLRYKKVKFNKITETYIHPH